MIALKFFIAKACEFKIESNKLDLSVSLCTLGSSFSMILMASPKLDWVTSIYKV